MAAEAEYIKDAGGGLLLFPERASAMAGRLDVLFYTLVGISVLIILGIGGLIFWYSVKYRAGNEVDRSLEVSQKQELAIEAAWTLPVLAIFIGLFAWGAALYMEAYGPVEPDLEVSVIGKQWMWKVQHHNGVREINELHVPVGQKIELSLTSQDVIHSFYIPAFRLKRDVVPQRYTRFWFEATEAGTYSLFCAEYCGAKHSLMRGRVVAMRPADFERWMSRQDVPAAPAAEGRELFMSFGCSGCHTPGSSVHAPSLEGLYGRPVQLADGGTVIADNDYIRDSILLPRKHVVAGYQPIMPSFEGQIGEGQILKIIAYIQSLDLARQGAAPP